MHSSRNALKHVHQREQRRLVSLSYPCPGVSLAAFLRHGHGQPRFYWESNQDDVAFAGVGIALEIMGWGATRFKTIERGIRELFANARVVDEREPLAAPRVFGGFAFRDDFVPDQAWSEFTPAHFVLPHYQLVRVHQAIWLTINVLLSPDENTQAVIPELHEALSHKIRVLQLEAAKRREPTAPAPMQSFTYPMSFDAWAEGIRQVTAGIHAGALKKVVLARVAEAICAGQIDVDGALDYLAQTYPQTYRFMFEPAPYRAFYGATPELLAAVDGENVTTMGLAGSIRRGKTPQEDAALAAQLLNSAKDRIEHQIVVDEIRKRLGPLTHNLDVGATGVMALSNIYHLHTPITGTLRKRCGILPVVETLHPTPALGGDPREAAMALIRTLEPASRGWYAGPLGWIDRHMNGQFAVAIRSAVVQEQRVWLYAGAGIVGESDPEREWEETALKFRPMMNALGLAGA